MKALFWCLCYSNLLLNLNELYHIFWKKINPTSFLPFSKGEDETTSLPLIKGGIKGGFSYDKTLQ